MLDQDDTWRHLCTSYWYATEKRLWQWSSFSPRGLYHALEQWAPLEGFYMLASAFPWGMLILLRISEGRVLADIIRFVPAYGEGGEDRGAGSGGFQEVTVPLFRASLVEEHAGIVQSALDSPWLGGADVQLSRLEPARLRARMRIAAVFASYKIDATGPFSAKRVLRMMARRRKPDSTFFVTAHDGHSAGCPPGEASPSHVLAQAAANLVVAGAVESEEESEDAELGCNEWRPGRAIASSADALARTGVMLQHLLGTLAAPCDLALICNQGDVDPRDAGFPNVRPGLYVGDYGHSNYGQFRNEVLLMEYVALSREQVVTEATVPTLLFALPRGEPAPPELGLLAGLHGPITFMRGVKQCGDFHVPMGATSFVVVCGPPDACLSLAAGRSPPSAVVDRQTQQQEAVLRAWRGFGSLASPGFRKPEWTGGWLVQLEHRHTNGEHRFGFVWDTDQDAVVLHWVCVQDKSPFLQRAWLPENLR